MAAEFFPTLLDEIGKTMGVKLEPDANNTCLLSLPMGVKIQLEMDRYGDYLVMGSELGELPAGKFREEIFKVAMKGNTSPPPRHGVLAFSRQTGGLILFHLMPVKNLQANDVIEFSAKFAQKAKGWQDSIANGVIPDISTDQPPQSGGGGLFGLQP